MGSTKKKFTVAGVSTDVAAGLGTSRTARTGTVATRDAARIPHQIDPEALGGTPEERLAGLEDIIDSARQGLAETVKAARTRFELHAGMALAMIRDESLYLEKGYPDFPSYVQGRWGYSLSRAYQLMDTVLVANAVSTIVETALPESHVRLLAVVIRQHGEAAAREILTTAQADSSGRITAKTLAAVRDDLKFTPAPRGEALGAEPAVVDAEVVEDSAEVQHVRDGLAALAKASRLLSPKNLAAALQHAPDLAANAMAGYEQAGQIRRRLRPRSSDPA